MHMFSVTNYTHLVANSYRVHTNPRRVRRLCLLQGRTEELLQWRTVSAQEHWTHLQFFTWMLVGFLQGLANWVFSSSAHCSLVKDENVWWRTGIATWSNCPPSVMRMPMFSLPNRSPLLPRNCLEQNTLWWKLAENFGNLGLSMLKLAKSVSATGLDPNEPRLCERNLPLLVRI